MKIKLLLCMIITMVSNGMGSEFKFLESMEFSVDLQKIDNQSSNPERDSLFSAWYYMEANTNFEVEIFQYGAFSLYTQYEQNLGMGQTAGNVFFDPMFTSYGINPWLEYRFSNLIAQFGIDHHCFHEIDRQQDLDVTLWNKPFLAIGSANKRNSVYRQTVLQRKTLKWNGWGFDSWKVADRLAWFVKFGYYANTVFGQGKPMEVNFNNPLVFETEMYAKFAIAEYNKTVFALFTNTKIGYYDYDWHPDPVLKIKTGTGLYYSSKIGAELLFLQGKHGFSFFVDYNFDKLPLYHKNYPRFSKDGLIEFGFKFTN